MDRRIGSQKTQVLKHLPGAREEGAKEMSGEERCRRVGVSGSWRARRLEDMTQSNTSSPRESEVAHESQRGMSIEVPQNEEISGGKKNGGRKGIGFAIRWRGANRGGVHIKK